MGQNCVRDGSDDEGSNAHRSSGGDHQHPKRPKHANKYAASERIISLEHVEHPHAKLCESAKIEKNFREFSRLFPLGEAALCVASCDTHAAGAKQLVTAGEDRSMSLVNYETGHVLKQWKRAHDRDVNCVTNPNAQTGVFCTGSRDTTVRLWKATDAAPLHILRGHKLNVSSVTVNPEGTMLVSGSRDNTVRLWDMESGESLSVQDVKLNLVHFVRWIAPLGCVAQGGEDLTLRLWDVRTEGKKSTLELRNTLANFDYHPICCDGLSESTDRAHVLYTGHNGFNQQGSMIYEWDLRMGKQVRQFDGHGFTVRSIHLLRSEAFGAVGLGGHLVSTSDDGTVRFWPLQHESAAGAASRQRQEGAADPDGSGNTMVEVGNSNNASGGEEANPSDLVHVDRCMKYELQEGRATCIDETSDGLLLMSMRNGTVVILKPSGTPEAPRPMQRYRYIGNPAVVE